MHACVATGPPGRRHPREPTGRGTARTASRGSEGVRWAHRPPGARPERSGGMTRRRRVVSAPSPLRSALLQCTLLPQLSGCCSRDSGSGRVARDTTTQHGNMRAHASPRERRALARLRRSLLLLFRGASGACGVGHCRRRVTSLRGPAERVVMVGHCCMARDRCPAPHRRQGMTLRAPTVFAPRAFVVDSPRNAWGTLRSPSLQSVDAIDTARRGIRFGRTVAVAATSRGD